MSHAPSAALSRRHALIRHTLAVHSLDALVVTSLPNVCYLTNFIGSAAIAVLTHEKLVFLTDSRYVTTVNATRGTAHECPDLELAVVDGAYDVTLVEVLRRLAGARVGFEALHLSVGRHTWIDMALGPVNARPSLVPTEGVVEAARLRKDEYERAILREAAGRLSEVACDVFELVRRGERERDIALALDWRIRAGGFARTAFDTIVASGPNAALPHARPGERRLAEGDLVVLDFGGVYDSYCVDLTRTVSVGPASERARAVHAAVRYAHACAVAAVLPGVSRFAIDTAARAALGQRGMADAFGHGTGHGLGLEVHEDPRIARRRTGLDLPDAPGEAVDEGMVFTIEPGAYFPGFGGVRIEDDVLVTETGVEVLTDVTTELLEL